MKLTRVFALAIAAVMLALSLASCGTVAPEITVTVEIYSNSPEAATEDDLVLNVQQSIQSEAPTVFEAVTEALIVNEIAYVASDDMMSLVDIKDFKDYTEADTGIAHYWMYYLNDVEPTSGKAGTNAIADGDKITYYYVAFDPATAK